MTLLMILLASLVGGTNTPLVKLNINYFSPPLVAFLRFFLASIMLLLIIPFTKQILKKPNKDSIIVNLLFAANILIFVFAIQYTSIIVAQSLYLLNSIFVVILGYFILKEKITNSQIIGLVVSTLGVFVILEGSIRTKDVLSFGTPLGNLLVFAGVVVWSFYIVFSRRISRIYSPLNLTLHNFLVTTALALFFLPFQSGDLLLSLASLKVAFFILSLAFFSTVAFFFLYQWVINHISAFVATLVNYLSTIFASMAGILFFQERLTLNVTIGAVLIVLGVYVASKTARDERFLNI